MVDITVGSIESVDFVLNDLLQQIAKYRTDNTIGLALAGLFFQGMDLRNQMIKEG